MWSKMMAVNSLVVLPIAFVFVTYALFRAVFFFNWKLFWIALVIFLVVLVIEVILGALAE
ncbi:MAG: hypothetical protein JO019_02515 [Candidatus Kaiserbacteria bacterium]|nr:hypothetical protein [Candidatus Kaiserbacteria bacterium]